MPSLHRGLYLAHAWAGGTKSKTKVRISNSTQPCAEGHWSNVSKEAQRAIRREVAHAHARLRSPPTGGPPQYPTTRPSARRLRRSLQQTAHVTSTVDLGDDSTNDLMRPTSVCERAPLREACGPPHRRFHLASGPGWPTCCRGYFSVAARVLTLDRVEPRRRHLHLAALAGCRGNSPGSFTVYRPGVGIGCASSPAFGHPLCPRRGGMLGLVQRRLTVMHLIPT